MAKSVPFVIGALTVIGLLHVDLPAAECVAPRHDVRRSMRHDDPAIQEALRVIGQPLNPIVVIGLEHTRMLYARVPGLSEPRAGLNAFRSPADPKDPTIYVSRASQVYTRAATRPSPVALLKLAATLLHEQVHNSDGDVAAYRLQSDFVRSRLHTIGWRQQKEARLYLEDLDARAAALARIERWRRSACGLFLRADE